MVKAFVKNPLDKKVWSGQTRFKDRSFKNADYQYF